MAHSRQGRGSCHRPITHTQECQRDTSRRQADGQRRGVPGIKKNPKHWLRKAQSLTESPNSLQKVKGWRLQSNSLAGYSRGKRGFCVAPGRKEPSQPGGAVIGLHQEQEGAALQPQPQPRPRPSPAPTPPRSPASPPAPAPGHRLPTRPAAAALLPSPCRPPASSASPRPPWRLQGGLGRGGEERSV